MKISDLKLFLHTKNDDRHAQITKNNAHSLNAKSSPPQRLCVQASSTLLIRNYNVIVFIILANSRYFCSSLKWRAKVCSNSTAGRNHNSRGRACAMHREQVTCSDE